MDKLTQSNFYLLTELVATQQLTQVHVVSVPVALFAGLVVLPIYCFVLLLRSGIYLAPHSGVYTPIIFGTPPNQTPL
jgi:hypothetical protein